MGINQNSVRHALKRAGFVLTERDNWNARWSRPLQCKNFKDLLPYQKLNHFPGTFELGRKDRLHRSLRRMQQRVGKEAMDFFPRCFLLPNELREFDEAFNADEKANNVLCLRRSSNAMRARSDYSATQSPSLAQQFARVTARCILYCAWSAREAAVALVEHTMLRRFGSSSRVHRHEASASSSSRSCSRSRAWPSTKRT
jgi:hypothetical protein